ncbi:MAG: DUF177 domain-containing protein [Lachnospiraceae bacterium]|nr:DUF177 domain-containing protein [Lachnospiraceae bacterium]
MLVNLTDVFTNEGKVINKEIPFEYEEYSCQMGTFTVKDKSPIVLTLSNIGQSKAMVEGTLKLVLGMSCDRCLQDVDYTFDLSFSVDVVSPELTEYSEDEVDTEFMEGYHLNVDALIDNEILLNWPMKILCKDSCKGICKVCGKNLNDGECGCDDFVPDPRMAAIKDIFNANKEV